MVKLRKYQNAAGPAGAEIQASQAAHHLLLSVDVVEFKLRLVL